jgi:hypothetical protein
MLENYLIVKLQGVFILERVELLKRKYLKEYARIAAYLPRRK